MRSSVGCARDSKQSKRRDLGQSLRQRRGSDRRLTKGSRECPIRGYRRLSRSHRKVSHNPKGTTVVDQHRGSERNDCECAGGQCQTVSLSSGGSGCTKGLAPTSCERNRCRPRHSIKHTLRAVHKCTGKGQRTRKKETWPLRGAGARSLVVAHERPCVLDAQSRRGCARSLPSASPTMGAGNRPTSAGRHLQSLSRRLRTAIS